MNTSSVSKEAAPIYRLRSVTKRKAALTCRSNDDNDIGVVGTWKEETRKAGAPPGGIGSRQGAEARLHTRDVKSSLIVGEGLNAGCTAIRRDTGLGDRPARGIEDAPRDAQPGVRQARAYHELSARPRFQRNLGAGPANLADRKPARLFRPDIGEGEAPGPIRCCDSLADE